jgi:RNA polymerase sigma factor (sigma-70 family)
MIRLPRSIDGGSHDRGPARAARETFQTCSRGTPMVYVVDDDPSVRQSLQRLLRTAGHQVATFATAVEFFDAYVDGGRGCLVLDQCLPGLSGLDVLSDLEARQSPLSVIFISGYGDVPTTVTAMKHGALDFLPKPFDDETLLEAVSKALARSTEAWTAQQEKKTLRQRFETLTPREREVCRLVAAGFLNKQTAFELGTAEKTVKVHRARVMAKLQVASLAELVRLVDQLGLTAPSLALSPGARSNFAASA